jgi:hypothetical protein
MAEFKVYLDAIAKFGVVPILCMWVYKLDKEQTEIKEKLFDCFDDKEDILKNRMSSHDKKTIYIKPYMVAVLPCKKNEKDEYCRENKSKV